MFWGKAEQRTSRQCAWSASYPWPPVFSLIELNSTTPTRFHRLEENMEVTPIGTIGGEGRWLLAISWSLTGVAALCFLLRLYTRLVVLKSYGWDDTVYNGSFVSTKPSFSWVLRD